MMPGFRLIGRTPFRRGIEPGSLVHDQPRSSLPTSGKERGPAAKQKAANANRATDNLTRSREFDDNEEWRDLLGCMGLKTELEKGILPLERSVVEKNRLFFQQVYAALSTWRPLGKESLAKSPNMGKGGCFPLKSFVTLLTRGSWAWLYLVWSRRAPFVGCHEVSMITPNTIQRSASWLPDQRR